MRKHAASFADQAICAHFRESRCGRPQAATRDESAATILDRLANTHSGSNSLQPLANRPVFDIPNGNFENSINEFAVARDAGNMVQYRRNIRESGISWQAQEYRKGRRQQAAARQRRGAAPRA